MSAKPTIIGEKNIWLVLKIIASVWDRKIAPLMTPKNSSSIDRLNWLTLAKNGDRSALAQLLQADRDYLLLVAAAELDSELLHKESHSDVVQDSIIEAQQAFPNFHGEAVAQWRQWLKAILQNNIKDLRRRYVDAEKRSIRREAGDVDPQDRGCTGDSDAPPQLAIRQEQISHLFESMDQLPDHYQRILELRYWRQMQYEEIAKELDSTNEAVRKMAYRAVEALADVLEKQSN